MTTRSRYFAIHTLVLVLFIVTLYTCARDESRFPAVPEWAKHVVWYQIFPERFRNGDTGNDPTREELELPTGREWKVSPWTSDWYELQPWERRHSANFYEDVYERRYGGDLQGVLDKLDYLQDLGITAIYFNPVFEAYSLHKYDASTYHHIDNNFGPDSQGDLMLIRSETEDPTTWTWSAADKLFLRLIGEAHKRGMKIIVDGVFNHCGTRFWAFQDVVKNQERSKYAGWFDVRQWDDPSTKETNEFQYKGWWGVQSLPEFKEDENGLVSGPREYIFAITKRWMDPNGDGHPSDGIDGWRLDVPFDVSAKFWTEWRNLVRSVNPEAYTTGEVWDNAAEWLGGDRFDAVMNYQFAKASVEFFFDRSRAISASQFDQKLSDTRHSYPDPVNYVLQNLIDSHDTDRLPSMIVNSDRQYDKMCGLRDNPSYDVRNADRAERQIQKLFVMFQMTYVGAPMVYYGDEVGMWGADDPDDRKPMVWDDMKYDVEKSHPLPGKHRPADSVRVDHDLFRFYKKMIAIRRENEALSAGDFKALIADDDRNLYGFSRSTDKNGVLVILNNGDGEESVTLDGAAVGAKRLVDALSGEEVTLRDGKFQIAVPGKWGRVMVKGD